MKRLNNKGLTLVELLIAIAILSVVIFGVGSFIVTGARGYASASSEINLQYEAQTLMNQIGNMMIDATEVQYDSGILTIKAKESGADVTYLIERDASTNKLIMTKNSSAMPMSEYVSDFSVDTSGINTTGSVVVTLTMEHNNKTYSATNNISLRNLNRGVSKNSVSSDSPAGPAAPTEEPAVVVTPNNASLVMGDITKNNKVFKANVPVTWTLLNSSGSSSIDVLDQKQVKVTLGDGESSGELYLQAVSVKNPDMSDPKHSALATIRVVGIEGVTVTGSPGMIYPGSTLKLTATVRRTDGIKDTRGVTYNVIRGGEYITALGDGSFKISAVAPSKIAIEIEAVSISDPTKKATYSTTVLKKNELDPSNPQKPDEDDKPLKPSIKLESWDDVIKRGGSGTVKLSKTGDLSGYTIVWDVTVENNETHKTYSEMYYGVNSGADYCTVNIRKTLKYDEAATVRVKAYLVPAGKSKDNVAPSFVATAQVDPVSVGYRPKGSVGGYDATYIDESKDIIYFLNDDSVKYEFDVKGLENPNLRWVYDDTNKTTSKVMTLITKGNEMTITAKDKTVGVGEGNPEGQVNGIVCKAIPVIDLTYELPDNYIKAKLAGCNFKFINKNSTTGAIEEVYVYVPAPGEKDFPFKINNAINTNKYNLTFMKCEPVANTNNYFYVYGYLKPNEAHGENEEYWYFSVVANRIINLPSNWVNSLDGNIYYYDKTLKRWKRKTW